jgi:hypothetical protein
LTGDRPTNYLTAAPLQTSKQKSQLPIRAIGFSATYHFSKMLSLNLGNNAGTDGTIAFANGKTHTLLDRDRLHQIHRHLNAVSRHYHLDRHPVISRKRGDRTRDIRFKSNGKWRSRTSTNLFARWYSCASYRPHGRTFQVFATAD